MRDKDELFRRAGAEVIAIGFGRSSDAAGFARQEQLPFPLLVDSDRRSYKAACLMRSDWAGAVGPKVWASGLRSLMRGRGMRRPQQDPLQLGGAMVVGPGGTVLYRHVAEHSADNAPIEDLLAALE